MEEKDIAKVLRKKRAFLLLAILALIISIVLIGISVNLDTTKVNEEPKDLHELIYNYQEKEGEYAKIEIKYMPLIFAVEDDLYNYYFATDKDNYLYIIRITDETCENLENIFKDDKEDAKYELKGYLFNIPNDLKDLAIQAYNEIYEGDILNKDNFTDYVGTVYLDENKTPMAETAAIIAGVGVLIFMLFVIFMISYIVKNTKSTKLNREQKENIKNELRKESTKQYKKQKIYLTDNYIISNLNGVKVLEYSDILWLYCEIRKINGISVGKYLIVFTSDKKKFKIAVSNNKEQVLNEITDMILEKNKLIKIGFTKENIKYFKDYKKGKIDL